MNVVETVPDNDGSAPWYGVQAGLANENAVVDSDQDEGRRSLPCNAELRSDKQV